MSRVYVVNVWIETIRSSERVTRTVHVWSGRVLPGNRRSHRSWLTICE